MKTTAGIPRPRRGRPDSDANSVRDGATQIGDGLASSETNRAVTRARRALMERLDRRIHRSVDLDYTLKVTVEELGEHLGVDRCVLWLLDTTRRHARPAFQYCAGSTKRLRESVVSVEFRDLAQTLTSQGALVLEDTDCPPAIKTLCDALDSGPPKSFMCLPVKLEGFPRALLTLACLAEQRDWSEAEIELGRAIADRLALAIRQAELFKQLRESAREAEALYRASSLLVDTSDIDGLYEQILDAVADVFGHPNSNIWLVDEATGKAVLAYTRGDPPDDMLRSLNIDGPGLIPHAVRSAAIVNVPDVQA